MAAYRGESGQEQENCSKNIFSNSCFDPIQLRLGSTDFMARLKVKNRAFSIPKRRLRSLGEDRLVQNPLQVRREVIHGPWRKRPAVLVWLAAIAVLILLFSSGQ